MSCFRGGKRFREGRFSGISPGLYIPLYIPGAARGYKVIFYDPSDIKLGELGSDIREASIGSIDFELCEFGCGTFRLTTDRALPFSIGYRTRVDIFPYFSSDPWYTGFVMQLPKRTQKREPFEYAGFGYFEQLDWVLVTKSYADTNLSAIIADIIQNIVAPSTHIKYNASKIASVSYEVASIDFDHVPAKEALETLAGFAPDYEYGVDSYREFYFREKLTEATARLWAGKHFFEFDVNEDIDSVRNKLYVKQGTIVSGSNIAGAVQNAESISSYGLREAIITVPEVLNASDALAWAQTQLEKLKDPKARGQVAGVFLDEFRVPFEARGTAIITDQEGNIYELPIRNVKYSISTEGILANLELESGR